jgi:hypothetical protein
MATRMKSMAAASARTRMLEAQCTVSCAEASCAISALTVMRRLEPPCARPPPAPCA